MWQIKWQHKQTERGKLPVCAETSEEEWGWVLCCCLYCCAHQVSSDQLVFFIMLPLFISSTALNKHLQVQLVAFCASKNFCVGAGVFCSFSIHQLQWWNWIISSSKRNNPNFSAVLTYLRIKCIHCVTGRTRRPRRKTNEWQVSRFYVTAASKSIIYSR